MQKVTTKAINKIIALCRNDSEIAKVVEVLDMIWTRDKDCEILDFGADDFNSLARNITSVRAGISYKLVFNDITGEVEPVQNNIEYSDQS